MTAVAARLRALFVPSLGLATAAALFTAPVAEAAPPQAAAAAPAIKMASPAPIPKQQDFDPVAVPELSTRRSVTEQQPDGTMTTYGYSTPINYLDDAGDWAPIDNTLVQAPGATYAAENKANEYSALVPENGARTPLRLEVDDAFVTMKMQGLDAAAPAIDGQTATYEVAPDTAPAQQADSVDYEATDIGIKESINLDSAPDPSTPLVYNYDLAASPGVNARLTPDGDIEFTRPAAAAPKDGVDTDPFEDGGAEESDAILATIPAGLMYDSAAGADQAKSGAISYQLDKTASGWTLQVRPDMTWLAASERVYPVVVDPTLAFEPASRDCSIRNTEPNVSACGNGNRFLRVGRDGSTDRYRALLNFDVSSIPTTARVDSAKVNLYLSAKDSTNSSATSFSLQETGKKWDNTASWNSAGAEGSWTGGNPTGVLRGSANIGGSTSGYREFSDPSTKPAVQGWIDGSTVQRGFVLKMTNETTNSVQAFYSSSTQNDSVPNPDAGVTGRDGVKPFINVAWSPAPAPGIEAAGDRSFWQYEERDLSDMMKVKANVGNGNMLLTATDATIKGTAGLDMVMTRYYNSAADGNVVGNMGPGWSTGFGPSVRLDFPAGTNGNRVYFYGASGYRSVFEKRSDGKFEKAEPGINADLEKRDDGSYALKWYDQSVYVFSANGRLEVMRDKNSNELKFTYGSAPGASSSVLTRVTDTRGRAMVLEYTDNLITGMSVKNNDETYLRWAYTYQQIAGMARLVSSQLAEVGSGVGTRMDNDPNINAATTYGYTDNGLLDTITDARENTDANNKPGAVNKIGYVSGRFETLTRQTDSSSTPDPVLSFTYLSAAGPAPTPTNDGACDVNQDKNPTKRTVVNGEQNGAGDQTRYCIDTSDRVLRVIDAQGKARSKSYTANSNVETADMTGTGAGTQEYSYGYDGSDNATSGQSAEGAKSSATYGSGVNTHSPTSVQGDDSGGTSDRWVYDYDDRNNLILARGPGNQSGTLADDASAKTAYRYCWTGKGQINRIDPVTADGAWSYSTDPAKTTSANGTVKSDQALCNVSTGSSQGNDVIFTYNGANELQKVDRPNGGDQTFTYDVLSRIATVTDGRGVTTTYKYDGLDRVVQATYAKSGEQTQTVRWTYDVGGNLTKIEDANGQNEFVYDELNRKRTENAQNPSGATQYNYDAVGNVLEVAVGGEPEATKYTYDSLNRMVSLNDQRPGDATITFEYDRHDKLKRTAFPMGSGQPALIQETRWNEDGNAKCMYSFRSGNGPNVNDDTCPGVSAAGLITFNQWSYRKDALSGLDNSTSKNMTSTKYAATELGGRNTRYQYDNIMRLKSSVTRPGINSGDNDKLREFLYSYDRHSNLIKDVSTGTTPGLGTGTQYQAFNPGDEICASVKSSTDPTLTCDSGPGSTTKFSHDGDGNLTTATGGGSGSLDGLTLSYNLPGQTASIDPPGPVGPQTNAYDGVMQDRRTQSGSTNMSYGFKGLTAQTTPTTSNNSAHGEVFVRDPAGNLLAMLNRSDWSASYYLTDDQNSVIGLMPQTGTSVTRYLYEPYGEQVRSWVDSTPGTGSNTGSENSQLSAPNNDYNPWGYASGYLDKATGFVKFGTRYYMPQHSTWTQMDPKNGSASNPLTLNAFGYAGSNPITNTDTSGRDFGDLLGFAGDVISISYEVWTGDLGGAYAAAFGSIVGSIAGFACTYGLAASVTTVAGAVFVAGGCAVVGLAFSNAATSYSEDNYYDPYYS